MIGSSIRWAEEIIIGDNCGGRGEMTFSGDDNCGELGDITAVDGNNSCELGEIMVNGDGNSGILESFTWPEEFNVNESSTHQDEEITNDDNFGECFEITAIDDVESYACLTELNLLRQLVAIEITIPYAILPVDINIENLVRFRIGIGNVVESTYGSKEANRNSLELCGKEVFPLKGILKVLCKKTGILCVEVGDVKSLNSEVEENDLISLNALICRRCVQMVYVFDSHYSSFFGNLRSLEITCCNKLKSLCPASIAGGFTNLEKLHIIKCSLIEEIFSAEKAGGGDDHQEKNVVKLPKLNEILLEDLPNLDSFCKSVNNKFSLPRLKKIDFNRLPKLTSLSADSDFPNPFSSKYPFFHQQVTVSNMAELKIAGMEHLRDLWQGETEDSSSLKVIPQSKYIQSLTVCDCNSLEVIYNIEDGSEIVTLSSKLSYLHLAYLPKLTYVLRRDPHIICQGFYNLKELDIDDCETLKSIFSLQIAVGLAMLEKVQVIGCKMMQAVFKDEDEETTKTGDAKTIVFPKLKSLTFTDLPNLEGFCKSNNEISLPQLQNLDLFGLPKLIGLNTDQKMNVNWSSVECIIIGDCGILEQTETWTSILGESGTVQKRVNLTNVKKLNIEYSESMTTVFPENACPELHSIESMYLAGLPNIKSVWQNGSRVIKDFGNLELFDVSGCTSLKTLFTPYMAKKFTRLKMLSIRNCESMEEVVADEEGNDVISTEKQILFPNLVKLYLCDLPNLSSVLPEQYVFNWASLDHGFVDEEIRHLLGPAVPNNLCIVPPEIADIIF